MPKRILLYGLIFITSLNAYAQAKLVEVDRAVNWEKQTITFYLTAKVDQNALPVSKQRTEGLITRLKNSVIVENMNDFPLDSWGPFLLSYERENGLTWNLQQALASAQKEFSIFSADMQKIRVAYKISFTDITNTLQTPIYNTVESILYPSNESFDYTGIVIYAAAPLPLRDNDTVTSLVTPSLLPSVLSASGLVLTSANTVYLSQLKKWGTAAYSYTSEQKDWPASRIGRNPLVISAEAITGKTLADVVISNRDANRILSHEAGRDLLQQGKVLIIINNPQEVENLQKDLNAEANKIANATFSNIN